MNREIPQCKYFQQGCCRRGDQCDFAHGAPAEDGVVTGVLLGSDESPAPRGGHRHPTAGSRQPQVKKSQTSAQRRRSPSPPPFQKTKTDGDDALNRAASARVADPRTLGLGDYASRRQGKSKVSDALRKNVRDATARRVLHQLGLPTERGHSLDFEEQAVDVLDAITADKALLSEAVRVQLGRTKLFVNDTKEEEQIIITNDGAVAEDWALLGRFDYLVVPVRADYDDEFKRIEAPQDAGLAKASTAPPTDLKTVTSSEEPPVPLAVAADAEASPDAEIKSSQWLGPPGTPLDQQQSMAATDAQACHSTTQPLEALADAPGPPMDSQRSKAGTDAQALAKIVDCDGPNGFAGWFWVVHTAAPNIGESDQAEDFGAYSVTVNDFPEELGLPPQILDEDLYVQHFGRIWRNSLLVMSAVGVEDAIFFPLGMGAFLRKLDANDYRYSDKAVMLELRRKVTDELMSAISEVCCHQQVSKPRGPQRVHLCLMVGLGASSAESVANHNCFLESAAAQLKTCPDLMDILKIHLNVDSFQLAHEMASDKTSKETLKVGILNGANKKLIGNHWFTDGARMAIDENLHRRSVSMSRAALLLNYDVEARGRQPNQLAETLTWLGGEACALSDAFKNEAAVSQKQSIAISASKMKRAEPTQTGSNGCCCRRRRSNATVAPAPEPSDATDTDEAVIHGQAAGDGEVLFAVGSAAAETPAAEAKATDAPAAKAKATDAPAAEAPDTETPPADAAVTEASAAETPAAEAPAAEAPAAVSGPTVTDVDPAAGS